MVGASRGGLLLKNNFTTLRVALRGLVISLPEHSTLLFAAVSVGFVAFSTDFVSHRLKSASIVLQQLSTILKRLPLLKTLHLHRSPILV